MATYKEFFDEAKVKLDARIVREKIRGNKEAEQFFEKFNKSLIDFPLYNIIRKMENYTATEFIDIHAYDMDISFENEIFKSEYKNRLTSLIKRNLRELSPKYCKYNVEIEEIPRMSVKITMSIIE